MEIHSEEEMDFILSNLLFSPLFQKTGQDCKCNSLVQIQQIPRKGQLIKGKMPILGKEIVEYSMYMAGKWIPQIFMKKMHGLRWKLASNRSSKIENCNFMRSKHSVTVMRTI